jgi:predicted secreted protein
LLPYLPTNSYFPGKGFDRAGAESQLPGFPFRKVSTLKKQVLFLVTTVFLLSLIATSPAGWKTTLTKEQNGQEITVKTGDVILVELESLGGAGYVWAFESLEKEYFESLKDANRSVAKSGLEGAPVMKTWSLKTRKPGETLITMYYFRAWEGREKAIDKFMVKVHIQ